MARFRSLIYLCFACLFLSAAASAAVRSSGYTRVFNGRDLSGWRLVGAAGPGYVVQDGVLLCPADGGGNLYLDREVSDFSFRFEFRLDKGGNNGVGIRAPLGENAAYAGMEIQILDDDDPMYSALEPGQYHGSIYKVVAAKRGALKPAGQWNSEVITAIGRRIRVRVNGKTIVDADLNDIRDPAVLAEHPGMLRPKGYIGFMGHGPSAVAFRNISIRDLSKPERDNTPPGGFTTLFNGKNLSGWKGLVESPPTRAKMTPEQLATAQKAADAQMRDHWKVIDGILHYDGKGNSLCTSRNYGNFEMLVDWKIGPTGDSGIYLRGSPQVQIWADPVGSGGLYNNQKNPSTPSVKADNPPGQWNRFRILMVGERVTVFLNDRLVVHNVVMENYWERDKPIYPVEQIELQHHGDHLEFKNAYIRELDNFTSSSSE